MSIAEEIDELLVEDYKRGRCTSCSTCADSYLDVLWREVREGALDLWWPSLDEWGW